jgi:hypothetical protein
MGTVNENFAAEILRCAIESERAAELLDCLFDGGSCTLDTKTGELVLVSADQLSGIVWGVSAGSETTP